MKTVLVVDDEETIRSSLQLLLKSNFRVVTAENGVDAVELLIAEAPDIVLLDLMMPRMDGIETLKLLKEKRGAVPVIMLSAANTARTAVQAMKLGALDYLNKPFDVEELTTLIIQTLEAQQQSIGDVPKSQSTAVRQRAQTGFNMLVGNSSAMKEVMSQLDHISSCSSTVLITGESGTGKEVIARTIHNNSDRNKGPFVAINCAAIPESLIESELFGHERGAFTSAVDKRIGHFELADGGTLFLDEIGELSPAVQVKMLRFLQEQEFYRVGSSEPISVNTRVVTATNRDLDELVKQGKFRQDLYYRIHVIHLELPALRERYEDIPLFLEYFVEKLSPEYQGRRVTFSSDALTLLRDYQWPGNVREVENIVESLLALAPADQVTPEMLPSRMRNPRPIDPPQLQVFDGSVSFEQAEKQFEREMIVKALRRSDFVQTRAASLLGISRRILKYKMDKLGIASDPANGPDKRILSGGEGTDEDVALDLPKGGTT